MREVLLLLVWGRLPRVGDGLRDLVTDKASWIPSESCSKLLPLDLLNFLPLSHHLLGFPGLLLLALLSLIAFP